MRRSWTILDFILIWLASAVFAVAGAQLAAGRPVGVATLATLAAQYVAMLAALWLIQNYRSEPVTLAIEPGDMRYAALGMGLQIVVAILLTPLARILLDDPEGPPQQIGEIIASGDHDPAVRIGLFLSAAFLAPLTEELLYRGVLFKAFRRRGRWVAIVGSAVVFGTVHLPGLDRDSLWATAAVVIPPLVILGLVLAWTTERKGRIGPAFFLHSGWNLLAALILLIPQDLVDRATELAGR